MVDKEDENAMMEAKMVMDEVDEVDVFGLTLAPFPSSSILNPESSILNPLSSILYPCPHQGLQSKSLITVMTIV